MVESKKAKDTETDAALKQEEPNEGGSTLLPMLVVGLVLIVIGAIAVMMFV